MKNTTPTTTPDHALRALSMAPSEGFVLEFGVWKGDTLRLLAENSCDGHTVVGFDSFEGFPEDWKYKHDEPAMAKDVFSCETLFSTNKFDIIKGWFSETVPLWSFDHIGEKVAMCYIDCDLYESAVTVLKGIDMLDLSNSVICFDDMECNGHVEKAAKEFLEGRTHTIIEQSETFLTIKIRV